MLAVMFTCNCGFISLANQYHVLDLDKNKLRAKMRKMCLEQVYYKIDAVFLIARDAGNRVV